jgi:hypothetical protein
MRNKPLTYLLILSVAAVWGIIFYRLFNASGEEEKNHESFVPHHSPNESLEDYRFKDTFSLALSYADPFLKGISTPIQGGSVTVQNPVINASLSSPKPIAPPINWEIIKYTGFILNSSGKKIVSIITISGKEYMLAEGDGVAGVKLLKNAKDSIMVSYQNKNKFIRIQ